MNTTETSTTTRCEAFKAVIRGQIMSYINTNSREINRDITTVDSKINLVEQK